jgi:hypothetical protein
MRFRLAVLLSGWAVACGDGSACGSGQGSSSDGTTGTSGTGTSGGPSTTGAASSSTEAADTSGVVDTGSSEGSTTMLAPDMGVPITEPMAVPCGTLDPRPPPAYDIFGDRYGAPWGFVVDGREYAALASTYGLSIIDVSAEPLVEVAFLEVAGYVPGRALAGKDHTLYMGGQGPGGGLASLRIFDVSDPLSPTLVGDRVEYTDLIHTINVYDDVLYLNSGFGACRFLTLDDPTAPVEVGAYFGNDCHDALAIGDRLYVGGGYTQRWDVVDISNLAMPAVLGVTMAEPGIYAHSGVVDVSGQYFLGLDEFHIGDMWIYDVSDPGLPTFVANFTLGPDVIPHNAKVRGNYLYAAWYEAGFVLLDIHDPTAPFEALRVQTWPDPGTASWDGAIEVDLNLPSGKVMVSDSREGLFVFCVATPP